MTVKMKVLAGALAGVIAGVGIAAATSASMAVGILDFWFTDEKIYRVKLIPQGTSGILKVKLEKGKKCNGNFEGCMQFAEDKVGMIKFYLPGSKKENRQCPGAGKVITEIRLSTTADPDPLIPPGSKGIFPSAVDPWLKNDAFPNVNLANGIVYTADINTGRSHVWLTNFNSNDASLGPKTFWYQVKVTNCSDASLYWTTDPRGDNTGLK